MTKKAKQKLGPNQRRWLRALTSGKYRQTRKGALKTKNGSYCCLGVACELFKSKSTEIALERNATATEVYSFDGTHDVAPQFVIGALGLRGDCGDPLYDDERDLKPLTELNDEGVRFKTIAAEIRKDPGVYFKAPK